MSSDFNILITNDWKDNNYVLVTRRTLGHMIKKTNIIRSIYQAQTQMQLIVFKNKSQNALTIICRDLATLFSVICWKKCKTIHETKPSALSRHKKTLQFLIYIFYWKYS